MSTFKMIAVPPIMDGNEDLDLADRFLQLEMDGVRAGVNGYGKYSA